MEGVEWIAMCYRKNFVNFVSVTDLHDELNEVFPLKEIGHLINRFLIIQCHFSGQIFDA